MSQATPGLPEGGFPINVESPALAKHKRRKKTPFWRSPLAIVLVLLAAAGGGVYNFWQQQQSAQGLVIESIPPISTDELALLEFDLPLSDPHADRSKLTVQILEGPEGAAIDPETQKFQWTPTEKQGPGEYRVTVQVRSNINPDAKSKQQFVVTVNEVDTPPEIEFVEAQTVEKGSSFKLPLNVIDPDEPPQKHRFELIGEVPAGASIDEEFGILEWYTGGDEVEADKMYEFEIRVSQADQPDVGSTRKFQATVKLSDPYLKLKQYLAGFDLDVTSPDREAEGPFAGKGRQLLADAERLDVFTYGSKTTADKDQEFIAPDLSTYFGEKKTWNLPTKIYRDDRMYVVAAGVSPELHRRLTLFFGTPIAAVGDFSDPTVASNNTLTKPSDANPESLPSAILDDLSLKQLETMYKEKELLSKKSYEKIRTLFAERFAVQFADVIERAYGEDREAIEAWFAENPDLKEEFYIAIDPQTDNVPGALQVFHQLWKKSPETVKKYGQLAIATSVVWDDPRKGVYDYTGHQRRTHSIMPEDKLADMQANFDYLVDNEKIMEGRAQLVPWEFLTHLVNHRTPIEERVWAAQRYLPKRTMYGECYHDVPYDTVMLETQSQQCKLQDKEYTLANLKDFGGVCAMQADYAARVGKSMGVPAEYVAGDVAIGGAGHAWVMWIELKNLTKTGINFSLESHGRFEGYESLKMYVGELRDPRSGKRITDRELELRLHTVGLDPIAKRQADLVMAVYPLLRERQKISVDEQVNFLEDVIKLSPGNESAWLTLAEIAGSGNLTKAHQRQMKRVLDGLFKTFANFPDFTWKVFDNLIQY
ncbi:MAG TPA: hypothetical protein VLA12_18430, partial [Planctomycetaceae bacterium]|nr:hypothetical protein [Planctomycetaceae bacterium]